MADLELTFETDEAMQTYWAHEARAELVSSDFDRPEAILAFRRGQADLLVPGPGCWSAYRLRELYAAYRPGVRTMTERLRSMLLSGSIA